MKVLQVNVTHNSGSTGRIASDIGKKIAELGDQSFIAYGRGQKSHDPSAIKIGGRVDQAVHLLQTRLFDNHGFCSNKATNDFLKRVRDINPDVIHLHNLHGYYINVEMLFDFLQVYQRPVVWTLHDCWAFTGHCTYFTHVRCDRWTTECYDCPLKQAYPSSVGLDCSTRNFRKKKLAFGAVRNLTVVTVSDWLKSLVSSSFLADKKCTTIYNGVSLDTFDPVKRASSLEKYGILGDKYVLAVANIWTKRKGLEDLLKLREVLDLSTPIVVVGLTRHQIEKLPSGIIGIERLQTVDELAQLYSGASVFVNPSVLETFGMVTAEALACGTPVVVYNATASPELVKPGAGYVVPANDIAALASAVNRIMADGKQTYTNNCRALAKASFDKEKQYQKYLDLYKSVLENENEE